MDVRKFGESSEALWKSPKICCTATNPMTDIAVRCGFISLQYIYRLFRRELGWTPEAFQESRQGEAVHRVAQVLCARDGTWLGGLAGQRTILGARRDRRDPQDLPCSTNPS
jgi:hypothetical protein